MNVQPTVGDWVVFNDGFIEPRYVAQRVTRVTAQKVMTREGAYRERHHLKENIRFVGTRERCERLCARLQGSVGLMADEQQRSSKRHQERVEKMIAEMST